MTYHILGCGKTTAKYDGHGISIGVNDCFRYGHKPNMLVICNHKTKFPADRLKMILDTRPVTLYTNCNSWDKDFRHNVMVKLRSWDGILRHEPDRLQCAQTSPFIAMSLAYNLGATKLVLWGVDFIDHSTFSKGNSQTPMELRMYRGFIEELRRNGIKTYLGAPGSLLEEFLTVHNGQTAE